MSEAITTTRTQVTDGQYKDINMLTAEINSIYRQTQETMLVNAVKLGRKLTEAKELLEHGQWRAWIEDNLVFGHDKADMLIKIYENYGSRQESIFGEINVDTYRHLGVYQAFALLKVPEEEREEFVKETHADEMSVRELKKAIAERDAAKAEQKAAEAERDAAKADNEMLRKANTELNQKAQANAGSADAIKKAEMERDAAEEQAKVALKNMGKLQENAQKLTEEKEKLLKQNEELTAKLTESKEPSAEFVENLRKELSEAAKAEGRAEAEKEIEALQKQLKASSRAAVKFEGAINALIAQHNVVIAAMEEVRKESPEILEKTKLAVESVCGGFLGKTKQL